MSQTKKIDLNILGERFSIFDELNSMTGKYIEKELNDAIYTQCFERVKAQPVGMVLDIGAHVGTFSILANKKVTYTHLVAVEPAPYNFENLVKNIELNCVEATTVPYAISNHPIDKMILDTSNTGATQLVGVIKDYENYPYLKSFKIDKTITLNELFEQYVKFSRVSLMKLDIEGAEYQALEGFKYWNQVDTLMFEIHWDTLPFKKESSYAALNMLQHVLNHLKPEQVFAALPFVKYYAGKYGP